MSREAAVVFTSPEGSCIVQLLDVFGGTIAFLLLDPSGVCLGTFVSKEAAFHALKQWLSLTAQQRLDLRAAATFQLELMAEPAPELDPDLDLDLEPNQSSTPTPRQ